MTHERQFRIHASQWDDDEPMEFSFQDGEGEGLVWQVPQTDDENGEEEGEREAVYTSPGFIVTEKETNEDGSCTFEITGSDKDMQRLMQALITQALINGVEHAKDTNEEFIARSNALKQADLLVRMLDVWEVAESFDYTPNIEDQKEKVKALLKKAGV